MAFNDERFRERLKEAFGSDTQTTVGEKLHITQGNVSKYLVGSQLPPMDILVRIAEVYGVSVDWLLGLSDRKEPADGALTYATAAKTLINLGLYGAIKSTEDSREIIQAELKDPLLTELVRKGKGLANADRGSYVWWLENRLTLFRNRKIIHGIIWEEGRSANDQMKYAITEEDWLEVHDQAKREEETVFEDMWWMTMPPD